MQYGTHRPLGHLSSSSALLALACIGSFKVDENPVIDEGGHKGGGALKVQDDTSSKLCEINLADPQQHCDTGILGLPQATTLSAVDDTSSTKVLSHRTIRQPAPLTRHAGRRSDVMLC